VARRRLGARAELPLERLLLRRLLGLRERAPGRHLGEAILGGVAHRLRLRLLHHLLERAHVGEPRHRPQAQRLLRIVEGHRAQHLRIVDALDGRLTRLGQLGVARHVGERLGVVQALERRAPDRAERRLLGHVGQRAGCGNLPQRLEAARLVRVRRRRRHEELGRLLGGRLAQRLVGIDLGDAREQRRVHDLLHRQAPHLRLGVFERHLGEDFVVVGAERAHCVGAHLGVAVLPLRPEQVEKAHGAGIYRRVEVRIKTPWRLTPARG
jgi:hypothetical protein